MFPGHIEGSLDFASTPDGNANEVFANGSHVFELVLLPQFVAVIVNAFAVVPVIHNTIACCKQRVQVISTFEAPFVRRGSIH